MAVEKSLAKVLIGLAHFSQDLEIRVLTLNPKEIRSVKFKTEYLDPSDERNFGHLRIDVSYISDREYYMDTIEYAFSNDKWKKIYSTVNGKMFY